MLNRQERRSVERAWRDQGALVAIHGLRAIYSCRLRDLSIKGAGLQLPNEVVLVPIHFRISLDGFHHGSECRLIWRHLGFVGIEFRL